MSALADFLLTRIAEDEAGFDPHSVGCGWAQQEHGTGECGCGWPGRLATEREAKRRIVEVGVYHIDSGGESYNDGCGGTIDHVLRLLAMPYAGHPDYRDEWRP